MTIDAISILTRSGSGVPTSEGGIRIQQFLLTSLSIVMEVSILLEEQIAMQISPQAVHFRPRLAACSISSSHASARMEQIDGPRTTAVPALTGPKGARVTVAVA